MKKKILLILMLSLLLMPFTTAFALDEKEVKYESMNLVETLESEGIELKYKDYKETNKQVPIYMFRGKGCTYCRAFLEYLNGITEEYGKYFKLVSYEVWTNSNNSELMEKTAAFLDQRTTGVPFIIIGDQIFPGYSQEFNSAIIASIQEQYENKNRYDVFEEMEEQEKIERRKAFFSSAPFIITCNTLITIIAVAFVAFLMNKKIKKLALVVEDLESKVKTNNKEVRTQQKTSQKDLKEDSKKNKSKAKK